MPLTEAQKKLVVKGTMEYLLKKGKMERNYESAKNRAIAHYSEYPFVEERKTNYKEAWNYMPAKYKLVIENLELVKHWIKKYAEAMFGIELTDDEVNAIINAAKAELAKYGITVTTV